MTVTILDRYIPDHGSLLETWDRAAEQFNALNEWKQQNRPASPNDLPDDWLDQVFAKQEQLGIPTIRNSTRKWDTWHDGQIIFNNVTGTAQLRVLVPIRDPLTDQITLGPYVSCCPHCNTLYASDTHQDLFCSDACRNAHQSETKLAKAARRKRRDNERSTALASRNGICLACGNQFNLKRITAKTCSDTCRKRLQRKPELANEFLVEQPVANNLKEAEASANERRQALLNLRLSTIGGGELTDEQQQLFDSCTAYLEKLEPRIQQSHRNHVLNTIAKHAPSLAAWLMVQTEEVQRAACLDWDGIQKVLGPALRQKLMQELNGSGN